MRSILLRFAGVLTLVCIAALCAPARAGDEDETLKKLVQRIATGDDETREDAEDELVRRMTLPLARAIGALEDRPIPEQLRIQQALNRVQSTLRIEIARATLKGEDRRLFDDYLAANREIALQLFDDAPQIRLAALQRVALKPDSGAGVLLALKVNDADAYVAEAALDSAMRLKDTVVARCLTHYVQSVAEALGTGFFGANDQDAAAVSAQYVRRAIEVIGAAKYRPAAPAIANALLALGRSPYSGSGFFELPPVAEALANLGDRKAAAALMHFLDKPGLSRVAPLGPGKSLSLTVGDEILLMFCKLYDQKPAEFGLSVNETGAFGYLDEDSRAEGHRRFRLWYREHGEPLPASQPATWTPGDAPKIAPAAASQPAEPAKKDAP